MEACGGVWRWCSGVWRGCSGVWRCCSGVWRERKRERERERLMEIEKEEGVKIGREWRGVKGGGEREKAGREGGNREGWKKQTSGEIVI